MFRTIVWRAGLSDRIGADSAGTSNYNIGQPPDPRAQTAARRRGFDIAPIRARQIDVSDFERYDLILAMDAKNRGKLLRLCPPGKEDRVKLLLEFAPGITRRDIPDPYGGSEDGFETVLDLIETAALGLLDHLRRDRSL